MAKKRCKLSDEKYEEKRSGKDKFSCKKCGRSANKPEQVCKSTKNK